ncbi:MAG: hypothetical protein J3Q66DRAFT_354035 [Benniella sp.]|nr:MAG: hypothetical protein J3Q66DRAFT_354035 [Benniella sp.]
MSDGKPSQEGDWPSGSSSETLVLKPLSPLTTQGLSSASLNNSGGGENNHIRANDEGMGNHQWSAIVQNTQLLDAFKRWYFKSTHPWYMGTEEIKESTGPATIQSAQQAQFKLPMQGIPVGNYGLVICVSFNDINIDDIEQWILDIRPSSDEGMLYSLDNSSTTVVKKDELVGLAKKNFIRFRIHSAVDHLVDTRSQFVTMRLDCKDRVDPHPSFEIHYIELDTNLLRSADTSDRILFGERKPTFIIGVGPDDQPKKPKSMQAFDISDTGKHAVTLYYSGTKAHIEVWDLEETKGNSGLSSPQILHKPYAHATIDIARLSEGILKWPVAININFTGTQVAICTAVSQQDNPDIPFRVFRAPPRTAVQIGIDHPVPWELEKVRTICDGQYFALASHHRGDPTSPNERFWVSDGRSFTVYNTSGSWSALYTLDMQPLPDILVAQTAMKSIHGRYFAWTDAKGAISIWDIQTGQLFSHLFIGAQGNSAFPVLSSDGSMIAVTRNNTIQIHDTRTGIKLGVFKKGLGNSRYFEVVFGKDHFMAYNPQAATVSKPMKHNMRSLVRLRDMAIVNTIPIHEDYRFNYPQTGGDPVFTFCHGPNLNILKMGPILSPVEKDHCGVNGANHVCETERLNHFTISSDFHATKQVLEGRRGERFILKSTVDVVDSRSMRMIHIIIGNSEDGGVNKEQSGRTSIQEGDSGRKSMSFPIGPNWCNYTGFFIRATSQLGVVVGGSLLLWTLSATKPWIFKLALIWRFQEMYKGLGADDFCIRNIISAESCVHGRFIKLRLTAPSWYRRTFDITVEVTTRYGEEGEGTLAVPMSHEDTISTMEERNSGWRDFRESQERRMSQGIADLIDVYLGGNDQCQDAIIQYLRSHIRPSNENRASSLISLCKAWKPRLETHIEQLLTTLLPSDCITWVPINNATKETNQSAFIQETNPLAIILDTAQKHSSALGAARIVINYCVEHANRSRNLAFLAPFFSCLRDIMKLYPDEAFRYLSRIAFIPVMHRSYLLDNCVVVLPPRVHWKFWKSGPIPLYKLKDQVFQLRVSSKEPDPNNEKFTRPVFMASFNALWHRQDPDGTHKELGNNGSMMRKTTWQKALLHMIWHKAQPRSHAYVKAYGFSIEFYDNPAIAALVAYKWNTIGYWYWFAGFFFQCCFYVTVVTASIMQVYSERPSQLYGLFLTIIVMASIFLWLELRQMLVSIKQYADGYNILDVLALSLPLVASAYQLTAIQREDVHGNTQILSFSVLVVFLHMLFELRIFKSVCKFVTIIQHTLTEIQAFFVIFAGVIFAFSIATLHLLRACAYEGCDQPTTGFPVNTLRAISAVYFFMGGRWDPVSDDFDSDNVGFHMMMVLFFFTSVVLMLNVLIALINVAFNKGDDGWRLAWIKSRLRYIEAAENLSYHIPGFRETYDFFPQEIYFSVPQETLTRNGVVMDEVKNLWGEGNDEDGALEANYVDVDSQNCNSDVERAKDAARVGKQMNRNSMDSVDSDGDVEDNGRIQGAVDEDILEPQVMSLVVANHEELGSSNGSSKAESSKGQKGKKNSVPHMEGTSSIQRDSHDSDMLHRLNTRVDDLHKRSNTQVEGLHKQIEGLHKQIEELKGLLLQHSAR